MKFTGVSDIGELFLEKRTKNSVFLKLNVL